MNIQSAISKVIAKQDLTTAEMTTVMQQIMSGQATAAQIAGLLIALRMKGESVTEITASAKVMRELATPVTIAQPHLIDIVGTGGDQANTFNISTTCAFVVAAAGGIVAKHGNRSVSSQSGSADLLEALGVNLNLNAMQVASCVEKINLGFMFAPLHHSAMKHAIAPRKELGVRTLFNLLGPLTNPAQATHHLIGVYDQKWLVPFAKVLAQLGSERALIVHSADGLDEISIADKTFVCELNQGKVSEYTLEPTQFGLALTTLDTIKVNSVAASAALLNAVLDNTTGPARDIVALNAGAAIYVAGLANDLATGIEIVLKVIAEGKAKKKLQQLIDVSNRYEKQI